MSAPGHARPRLDVHRPYWESRCRRLAAHVFLGRVLEHLGPALLAGSALTACAILLARFRVLPAVAGSWYAWLPLALATVVALVLAARRGWPRATDVRVRIEEAYRLHNQLSAAAEGTVAFPPPPGDRGGPTEDARVIAWRWSQVLPIPVASLALLLTAILIPARAPVVVAPPVAQKPPPLERLEELLEQLNPARAVDERALEELRSQVEELAGRDPEDWYSHASLEAAETLLNQTESGLNELASHMTAAARALDQMAGAGQGANSSSEEAGGLDAAMHGIEHGRMPGAGDVSESLRAAANRQLDPDAARRLAESLRKNSDFLQQIAQNSRPGGGPGQFSQLGAGSTPGDPDGDGQPGVGPGQGSVERGPGTAPITLAQNETTAQPGADGSLQNVDLERAALGDAAGQSFGEHEINRETAEQSAAGGNVAQPGSGGEAAWTQRLTPEERRAVRRTFE